MCLGIPGRIVEVWDESGTRMAHVAFPGETRKVCLAYLPDLAVDDYTMVHAGFALTRLDQQSALHTLDVMREYQLIDDTATGHLTEAGEVEEREAEAKRGFGETAETMETEEVRRSGEAWETGGVGKTGGMR
nr:MULTISPECIES: HypC/HybG/HupF family hydrogenase formation chaperone [Protofrankia]